MITALADDLDSRVERQGKDGLRVPDPRVRVLEYGRADGEDRQGAPHSNEP